MNAEATNASEIDPIMERLEDQIAGQLYEVQVASGSLYSQLRYQGISKIFPAVIWAE
jgi:hypothetical protein